MERVEIGEVRNLLKINANVRGLCKEKCPTENSWTFKLVEAAGIEPASASTLQAVLHT